MSKEPLDCAGAYIFFFVFSVFSVFDVHAVLCDVNSDKEKFKDEAFINRWSASQMKHITAKSSLLTTGISLDLCTFR